MFLSSGNPGRVYCLILTRLTILCLFSLLGQAYNPNTISRVYLEVDIDDALRSIAGTIHNKYESGLILPSCMSFVRVINVDTGCPVNGQPVLCYKCRKTVIF